MRWDGRPFSVGADAPGRPLLPLRGNSPSAHIGPSYSRLMHLPCNPFLYLIFCQASGGPLDGSLLAAKPLRPTLRFRFPPFPVPIPLKTTKEGAFGPPSLESPPSCSTDSAPAAGAYSVTPPPHRPVWEETGRRCLDIGAGLSPARRWFPRVGADAYIGPYERTAAASPRRGRTLAGLSLPYLPFSTLVGAAFMAARGRPQGSPLPLANNQAPASAPFGADAGANLT